MGAAARAVAAGLLAASVAAGGWPVVVTDATGARLVLGSPPARVVSLAPSVTEVLWAVGAAGQVAGVSSADDYPPEVQQRPKVGGVRVDEERLASLRPDLVVGLLSLQRATLLRLRTLGYRVLAVDSTNLEDTYRLILVVGRATGHEKAARALVQRMRRRVAAVEAKLLRVRPVRVFVQVWDQPFLTAGAGTVVDDLVRRAGGRNVFADHLGWPQVSEEDVVARDPECVLVLGKGARRLRARPAWSRVTAVRRGCLVDLEPSPVVRPGPRLVLGLEAVARALHPGVGW